MGEEEQAVVGSNNFSSLDDGKQSWRGISWNLFSHSVQLDGGQTLAL